MYSAIWKWISYIREFYRSVITYVVLSDGKREKEKAVTSRHCFQRVRERVVILGWVRLV